MLVSVTERKQVEWKSQKEMTIFKINKILIFLRNMHHQSCHSYQILVRMSETREYGCRFMNHTILTAICHFCPLLCVSYTSRMRILEQSGSGRMLMTVNDGQIHKIKGIVGTMLPFLTNMLRVPLYIMPLD